jgi:hypothetical protein
MVPRASSTIFMFSMPDTFSAVRRASGPVFMFCTTRLVFGGSEGFVSRFAYFASLHSFSAVSRASGPVFTFCASELIFSDTEGVGSHFHILRAQTRFRLYRGRRLSFSCFKRPNSFSAVSRVSVPVFMFCAPRLIFSRIEVVVSHFHFLRSRTHFWWYRGCRAPFSYFARPDSFSTDPRASGPVFMFCVPDSFSTVPRA